MSDSSARPRVSPEARGEGDDIVGDIISEFSEVIAFARSRWARYAEEVHADLRGVGLIMLQMIVRKGPLTATGIAQMLDMDKAVVSRQLAKLRELGLVETEPAAEDRRVVLLTPSARAQELLDGIRVKWAEAYHERFSGWSDAELEQLRGGLHRFNATAEHAAPPDLPSSRCTREVTEEPAS
ncbi:MarR family winged helix-turn-helix transcriptional regulator [Leucobacter luti]|uniref:DNA-binding MarR family transcriptional regulator n=1 Tax=Leucobacter luti TaxID=340320 RepID=A0A4Q7TQ76_9MICO|nr:MarR family transcriptional regulator [Leucobacter luti]MBL3699764.1 MarR family transcriptional regulator [Leucobacter luti]RZT62915.1 DNA-binding MarR family transcriptional regulator [Leucobacter luti]